MTARVTWYAVETKSLPGGPSWEPVAAPWSFTTAADAHERIAELAKHWTRVGKPFPGDDYRVLPFETEAPVP